MRILLYHKNFCKPEQDILERAAQRKHMLKKTVWWDVFLFLMTSLGGTLLFLFSPVLMKIPVVCAFVPVQNSVWENLKIIYTPSVLTVLIRYFCTGNLQKGILTTYAEGVILTMGIFLTAHYLITGILGTEYFLADIVIFYTCSIILVRYLRTHADRQKKSSLSGFLFILLLTGCFLYFTFYPPVLGIFAEISLSLQ